MAKRRADLIPAIEGYFKRTRSGRRSRRKLLVFLPALVAILALLSPMLILPAIVCLAAAALLFAYRARNQRVLVRLDSAQLTVSGGGYDIKLSAPFRCKTGVERIAPTEREEEICFIRMVIDAQGKPLVLEEQVLAGYVPPPLDEIRGISSALGVAELTSLTPYPGTLWALIEHIRRLEASTQRLQADETIQRLILDGERQLRDGLYGEAIATFSSVIRQAPESAAAYFGRGSARCYARHDLDKAVNDLTTTLRLDPQRKDVYRMRALARAALGDWTSLRDDCSAALQFLPQTAELYNLRGTASYRLEDYDGAMADFDEAIKLAPQRPESYYNRGLARQQAGQRREALADFQRALSLNPKFEPAARSLNAAQSQTRR